MDDVKTLAQLLAEPPRRGDWGPWLLDEAQKVLHLEDDAYWIDLQTCLTPAATLDWVMQLAGKSWADDRVLAGLVRAFDDILHPQANLCSHGLPSSLHPEKLRGLVADVAKWLPPEGSTPRSGAPSVAARLDGIHLVVDDCPWCHRQHHHGAGAPDHPAYPAYGPRVAHCGSGKGLSYCLVPPGPEGG